MLNNEYLNANINHNSLQVDKELTRMARQISTNINKRMGEVQQKADELEKFSKLVSLRVSCASSKMANLKNHKAVKQVISTQNMPIVGETRVDTNKEGGFTPAFLEAYKKAILDSRESIQCLENSVVFTTGSIQDAHPKTDRHMNGLNEYEPLDASETSPQNGTAQNKEEIVILETSKNFSNDSDEGPHLSETVSNQQNAKPSRIITGIHTNDDTPSQESYVSNALNQNKSVNGTDKRSPSERPSTTEAPTIEQFPIQSAVLASVIGEMKEKVAAKAKLFDSDSDSDKEPINVSQTRPSTSHKIEAAKTSNVIDTAKQSTSIASPLNKSGPLSFAPITKVLKPRESSLKSDPTPENHVESTTVEKVKDVDSIKVGVKKVVPKVFDSDSESDSNIFESEKKSASTSISVNPPENKNNIQKPVNQKSELAKIEEKEVLIPSLPHHVSNKPTSARKPVAKKSLFSSDSDSDDDFLKSFSKTKPGVSSFAKPIGKSTTQLLQESKTVDNSAAKSILSTTNNTTTPDATAPLTTTKKENKPSIKKSLFDDSDSDSDLFTFSAKLKTQTSVQEKKKPSLPQPEMNSISSSIENSDLATPQKTSPDEALSARIALIEQMQKSFRVQDTSTNIPSNISPVALDKEEADSDDIATVRNVLKSRARGPLNRRPPTRSNVPK